MTNAPLPNGEGNAAVEPGANTIVLGLFNTASDVCITANEALFGIGNIESAPTALGVGVD